MSLLTARRVSVAIIAQIATLAHSLHAVDQSRATILPTVLQQVVLNLSLTTAVTLGLYGFFGDLATAQYVFEVRDGDYELSQTSGRGSKGSKQALSKIKGNSNKSNSRSEQEKHDKLKMYKGKSRVDGLRPDLIEKHKASVVHGQGGGEWEDRGSQGSQDNIIRQTTTWEISYDTPMSIDDEDEVPSLPKRVSHEQVERRARHFDR